MAMTGGGAIGIGPVFPQVPGKMVGIRYELHIETALPAKGVNAIVFNGMRLLGPMGAPYLPEVSLFQWYPDFAAAGWAVADIGCRGWPPRGKWTDAPSLWVRIADQRHATPDRGLIGLRCASARTRRAWGVQNAGADNIEGYAVIDAAYQGSMQGAQLRVTLQFKQVRNVIGPRKGFGHRFDETGACRDALYPDVYAVWVTTLENLAPRARTDWKEYEFETLVPARYAEQVAAWEPCTFLTEFIDRAGPMVVHYRGMEMLQGRTWHALPYWKLHYQAPKPDGTRDPIHGYGWKHTAPGQLTLSNTGEDGYPQYQQVLDIGRAVTSTRRIPRTLPGAVGSFRA